MYITKIVFSDSDISPEMLALMKEKLPGYVLKCFLATGFDFEEAIAYMDKDSVKTMETFIEKRFSHDPNMHSQFSVGLGLPNEFPPGHKV